MPVAANITEAIAFAPGDIAEVSYQAILSLNTQMLAWIAGMYSEPTGIFPPSLNAVQNPGQHPVTNWYTTNLQAQRAIEGPGVGASGLVGTSACIDAVVRSLSAVKDATLAGTITSAQQTAVVTLYNTVWA